MNDTVKVTGLVLLEIRDESGDLKHQSQHNTITTSGLGYLADLMANAPTKTKFDTAHTYIVVGTGNGSVSVPKAQTWVYTQVGTPASMQLGYPQVLGSFPTATVTYSAFFAVGSLNATNINEACLVNNPVSGSGVSLGYAQVNPAVNVLSTDTLTVTWQITFA